MYEGACVQMHCVRMYRWRCRCGGDAGGQLASFKGDLELSLHGVVAAVDQHAVVGERVELGVQLQLRCVVLHVALQTTSRQSVNTTQWLALVHGPLACTCTRIVACYRLDNLMGHTRAKRITRSSNAQFRAQFRKQTNKQQNKQTSKQTNKQQQQNLKQE